MKRPNLPSGSSPPGGSRKDDTGSDERDAARRYGLWLAPGGRAKLGRAARAELGCVHAREVAYLLREAARLRAALDPEARRWRWLSESAGTLAAWRRALRDELALLARDRCRASPDLAALLEGCRAPDVADWPAAVELAEAALAVATDEVGRLEHAVALLARGDFASAAARLARELDSWLPPRREAEFLAALALAHQARRRFDEALGWLELALERVERTETGVRVAAHQLYLALALGAREPALRAAEALVRHSSRADFDARAFERCTHDLRDATERLRDDPRAGRRFGVHPAMERQFLRFTAASPAVVRRVAVALC